MDKIKYFNSLPFLVKIEKLVVMKKIPHAFVLLFCFLLILLIAYMDSITGAKTSYTILYVIPLGIIATLSKSSRIGIIAGSSLSVLLWVITYLEFNSISYILINGILRFVVFLFISFVLQQLVKQKALLNEYNKQLKETNANKDRFFHIVSHDLRSPFNSILGFSSLLIDQVQNKDLEGIEMYAKNIYTSSERALKLLNNLLDWSRSQTGRFIYNPEKTIIVDLFNEVIEQMEGTANQKTIALSIDGQPDFCVYVDKLMIKVVLRNILSNAIKFTNPGGNIFITTEQDQNKLKVGIQDNGIGIGKEVIAKLFLVDEIISTTGTHKEPGTGLGLLLCKEFVEKHDGKIWVESEVGKGSKFYFTIPLIIE
jgi:two-component system sensor histidine kinase/response regulator